MNFMMDCCCAVPASPGIAPLLGSSMVKSSAFSCVSWISRADGDLLSLAPAGTAPKRSGAVPNKVGDEAPPPAPSKSVPPPAPSKPVPPPAGTGAAPQLPKMPLKSAGGASRDGGCCASGWGAAAPSPNITLNPAAVCCACACAKSAGEDCCCCCGCAVKLPKPDGSVVAAVVTAPNPAGGGGWVAVVACALLWGCTPAASFSRYLFVACTPASQQLPAAPPEHRCVNHRPSEIKLLTSFDQGFFDSP